MALAGVRVLEMAGLAPSPFTGMVLADFGAKVIRVDRCHAPLMDTMGRGKRSIAVNLKNKEGVNVVKSLSKRSDVIIEPFRPGVMEKLGLGPDILTKENSGLVYVRLSGYGQTGPYRMKAGHDNNYISTSGVLSMATEHGKKPSPPMNLLADFAGGGLLAAFGIMAALHERHTSGKGQVIDLSMVEGSAYVGTFMYTARRFAFAKGHMLDGSAHFYCTYETRDGKYVSVGAIEPQFYSRLLEGLNLDPDEFPQMDMDNWQKMKAIVAGEIKKYTRDEICAIFSGDNCCVMPVLTYEEAPLDPHNAANGSFFKDCEDKNIPYPAPRLSRTPGVPCAKQQPNIGQHTCEILTELGLESSEISNLLQSGAIEDNSVTSKL